MKFVEIYEMLQVLNPRPDGGALWAPLVVFRQ